ncbi:hypothetical protein [Rhodanobacter sp. L36]|uniref:hypothetical protein n=1 Tax=Rhodanobacter sp. L36 TaxID=1747221 RepID=UPI00131E0BB1|nr:hypothetical protein [Rhodanobacter sp. L36]
MATVAQELDRRSAQALQHIENAAANLHQSVTRLDSCGERFAKTALGVIGSEAKQTITHGTGQAVGEIQQQLLQAAQTIHSSAQEMEAQRKGLNAARRSMLWNGLGALLIGSMLAAGGTGYFAWKSTQDIAQAKFGSDILQATQSGTLTRCGDMLCVKTGKKPQRYGQNGEYLLLRD